MEFQKLFLATLLLLTFTIDAQNLHDDSNAAFPSNLLIEDTNATNGWTSPGSSIINSISSTPQNGLYAVQLISTSATDIDRVAEYTFDAVVSETYNISIWVREGDANNSGTDRPEFSNWADLTGFTSTKVTSGTTWTEYTFSVTANSTTPIIRIYAHTLSGTIGDSVEIDNVLITNLTSDTTPPSIISDLSAASVAETTLTLNWTAATDNVAVTDYGVFKDGSLESLTANANTYEVTGLTPGNSYNFTVYSIDAANNLSLVSNTLNETTIDVTAPTAISDLSSASVTETTLTLNWTVATDNVAVTDYEVFQDAVSIGLTGGPNTLDVTGLTLGNTYAFTVFAKDAAGNTSLVSNTHNISTIDVTAPTSPENLYSSNVTAFTVELNWSISQSLDVTGYRIYQVGVGLVDTVGNQTSYLYEELEELTFYSFYIAAIDGANNESAASNTVGFTTPEENGAVFYNNLNSNLISVDWTTKDLFALGNVGIGTSPDPNYKLAVDGNIVAEEVRVALKANWPDYVFKKDYKLPTLIEVEKFIKQNGHLKNIPSAGETEKNGISIGDMNSKLLRKVEELTLYIIDQEKKINKLSNDNRELKLLKDRILEIEKEISKIK